MAIVEHGSTERIKSKLIVAGVEVKMSTTISYPKEIESVIGKVLAFMVASHETVERVKFTENDHELEQLTMDFIKGGIKLHFRIDESGAVPGESVDQDTGEIKPGDAEKD